MPRISRRTFLVGAGAVGGAALTGGVIWSEQSNRGVHGHLSGDPTAGDPATGDPPAGAGPLVVVSLYGGNDGLNTVIPYADSAYLAARPGLGYPESQVLPLTDGMGLNPKLTGFQSLWKSGQLAVIRGVGYPNPNLSHFESMDIWQTANPVDGTGVGWLGRWLDATGDDPMRAISVGATLPPFLRGEKESATAITAPQIELPGDAGILSAFTALQRPGPDRTGLAAAVAGSGSDLLAVKGRLDDLHATDTPVTSSTSPAGMLSSQLEVIAALINAGAPTRVYQASLASFDTHADEKANHENLLTELDQAVTGFVSAIGSSPGSGRNAVLMTFSEFGRRPAENASGGTDHGTAAPLFVAGRTVKGGQFYGEQPSLTRLDPNGNLIYNVDFRSVYATVLDRVVGFDSTDVLGKSFASLTFL